VDTKFPEMHQLVVSGFIFLRFFCPAIVTPEKYHLVSEPPPKEARRGLILVSKLLQNLANGVEFDGSKEEYMKSMNHFVTSNLKNVTVFFDKLTDADKASGRIAQFSTDAIDAKSDVKCLLNYLANKIEIIRELIDAHAARESAKPVSSSSVGNLVSSAPPTIRIDG